MLQEPMIHVLCQMNLYHIITPCFSLGNFPCIVIFKLKPPTSDFNVVYTIQAISPLASLIVFMLCFLVSSFCFPFRVYPATFQFWTNQHSIICLGLCLWTEVLNIVVKWLALLLHIQEVLGSNWSPDTIMTEVTSGFPQSFQANSVIIP